MRELREDFPLIRRQGLTYLDSAATTQKPDCVIQAISRQYERCNANVHRSCHRMGGQMSQQYEAAREKIADFFGADEKYTAIFTRGTTEAVNLAASSVLPQLLEENTERTEVVVTAAEHHSNFVPWQQWCRKLGMTFRVVPVLQDGQPDLAALEKLLTKRTALLAAAHLTNVFGSCFPAAAMTAMAHRAGACVLLDGAQAAGHLPVNLAELDCDFYCISGHKMYGPNGIGLLLGKKKLLERSKPWQYGGEMIGQVLETDSTYAALPYKFEAGTPDYIGAVGLAAAVEYLQKLGGMEEVERREAAVYRYLTEGLEHIPEVILPVSPGHSCGMVSFLVQGMHPYDTAVLLDAQGIAVRSGMHCAQPLMRFWGLPEGTVRVSLGLYNTKEDADRLFAALDRIVSLRR